MIINICGTNGSGKSTIVRKVMDLYDDILPLKVSGRKQPVGYTCRRREGRNLFVPGHYETPCGGCDTLANFFSTEIKGGMMDGIFSWLRRAHDKKDTDVIFEGLLIKSDVRRFVEMWKDGYPVIALTIDISIEKCLESLRERREAKGNFTALNPKNILAAEHQFKRRNERLTDAGVECKLLDREKIMSFCKEILGFKRDAAMYPISS